MTICQCRYYYYIYELEKTHYTMKTLNHILKSIIETAASAVFLYGCGNVATTPDNSFAEYIEAYTGGIVSSDNSIVNLQRRQTDCRETRLKSTRLRQTCSNFRLPSRELPDGTAPKGWNSYLNMAH